MRQRIRRYIDQRTLFLAGVSHDLRTPLTRLKLHLAMQTEDEDVLAAKRDLKDMENMLNGYLDFVRGVEDEPLKSVKVEHYFQDIVDEYQDPHPELILGENVDDIRLKTTLFKRAMTNLIDNACKYASKILLTIEQDTSTHLIYIEDNGPGIPADKYSKALRPFQRLDTARNQNIKGTGLGLSISRDILQNHGGTLRLDKSDMGGLKVILRLPI